MNCIEVYWDVNLPPHFIVDHPLGTVLGHDEFGDYLSVYQGVTVGGNVDKSGKWVYPKLGNYVTMYANSSVLGSSEIGDYVILSANSLVFNEKIPANSLVFGQSPNLTVKTYTQDYIRAKLIKEWIFENG